MKTIILLLFYFAGITVAQEFQAPESAAFDPKTQCYFVSNFDNGNIIRIDSTGQKSLFQTGLSKSLGMIVQDNILFVVNNTKMVKGFNLSDASLAFEIQIEKAVFLNDVTGDESGWLYVTDSNASAIYKIDIAAHSYSLLLRTELNGPNGIVFDKAHNRLVVCYFRENSSISEISPETGKISHLITPNLDNLDGITMDSAGNFYVSSWNAGSFKTGFSKKGTIYKFDNQFKNPVEIISTGHHGPADIFYNTHKQELLIPLFFENKVRFISAKQQ